MVCEYGTPILPDGRDAVAMLKSAALPSKWLDAAGHSVSEPA
jgi:hypothetical protein